MITEEKSYLDVLKECQRLLYQEAALADIMPCGDSECPIGDHERKKKPSPETQKQVFLVLKNQFDENMAGRNKHLLEGAELEEYLQAAGNCLKKLSNDLFQTGESVAREYRLPYTLWSAFMRLKYESESADFFIKEGKLFCRNEEVDQTPGLTPVVMVELMEELRSCEAGAQPKSGISVMYAGDLGQNAESGSLMTGGKFLRMDASIDRFVLGKGMRLRAVLNGREVADCGHAETVSGWAEADCGRTETVSGRKEKACGQKEAAQEAYASGCLLYDSPRYAQRDFFGRAVTERRAFVLQIPEGVLQEKNSLQFILEDSSGNQMVVPMVSIDYQAKLTTVLRQAYWCFGPYMATFAGNNGKSAGTLLIEKAGKRKRVKRELKLLKEIMSAPYGSRRMFSLRCLYWLTYPVYERKNIWVTFDKLYKGGDCGEYFYKFLKKEGKDVTPVYVLKKNTADWKRLEAEGYEPSLYGSTKQRLLYLHAKMVFATHSSVHSFCGLSKWEVRFVQDRIKSVNTCIQHGLSVQDLTFDSNRIINNNKRYYCASRYEVENLSRPAYDYGSDVLRLTGIPRYDGLVNQDKKQILITPTWRAYIAMPAVMGESRPYNPQFRNTDYYKIFQSLLEHKRLSEVAAKTGYKIVYLLHPVISAQKEDFRPANDIEIVSAVDVNYEKILTESSLMVTDYSGVQFDFAYMRKPVVYFHPPKLPSHYVEGGFFYETQGFGEICGETEELVDVLCEYMENGCQLKEFYRERQDDFFAFDDQESCRRIYEDARAFQKAQAR